MTNNDRVANEGATGDAARASSSEASDPSVKASSGGRRRVDARKPGDDPHIGKALRSVYDKTVGEAIPDEMLALLGRLD